LSGFSSYATTAAANVTINGLSIAEGCPAANINNAIRELMADARAFADSAASTTGLMPKSGGAFTGQITRSGAGGYLYNANSAQSGGAVYVQASGTALPSSPTEGTFVFFY
jgi:hypothetical protein